MNKNIMKRNMPPKRPKYKLSSTGEFSIENYNFSKPFANFFPGIAGPYGIPIWAFYVNRGQAISSFGSKDKDHSILEFFPANKAWQQASLQGFRSFIKVSSAKNTFFYEPFHNGITNSGFNLSNRMRITSYDLKLEEDNPTLGITTTVKYFTIPNDNFGGLARIVTLKNTGKTLNKIQFLDGLPQIVPFGTNNFFLKKMSRTIEAWMKVKNLENNVPFYKLAVDPSDRPEVIHINQGNFYLAYHYQAGKPQIIKPIVDPQNIFGPITDFTLPYCFVNAQKFRYPKQQATQSKTPCAFLFSGFDLAAGQEKTFYSLIGYMPSQGVLNSSLPRITAPGYLDAKKEENRKIIEGLQQEINTASSLRQFDLYARQTYLDNILRGGWPAIFKSKDKQTIFYLYSRKHGDLERDYNKFQLQPLYFSQGNGNYRDVNQNRRSDIWFNPEIKDENIITFFNLLQADGFNPLIVNGVTFTLKNSDAAKTILKDIANKTDFEKIVDFLEKNNTAGFTPGELILFIEENKIKLNISRNEFIETLLGRCHKNQVAEHGEGFWTDHWAYNLDLLESYLGVYPEALKEIIFDNRAFTFYDNIETVKPRREKYVLYNNRVRQLHSVGPDPAKKEMLRKRSVSIHTVRERYGEGEIYSTSLMNKLLCLAVNKMASLDPFGLGIEMEADKPNWFDSLNGLPALFGSSLCETLELKRLIIFIKDALIKTNMETLPVTEEIRDFLLGLDNLTREYYASSSNPDKDYFYWDRTHLLKEDYHAKTKLGFSGSETQITTLKLIAMLDNFLSKINAGIDKARAAGENIYYAYFINEVVEYEPLKDGFVRPLKFSQKKLPFFLEAQVHALKLTEDTRKAKALYEGVKKSSLYDKKLKMYKVTAPLTDMPEEIGRCRIFTPGWLENESIWLHMEYKYLLEILRSGLYADFYQEFKQLLIPFRKPEVYGRSILENSSFIVSSAFPDKNLQGNGFVARLSGSTAEFLQIWLIMNLGLKPFTLNDKGELNLRFKPILAGWLFRDKDKAYSFNFLGKILVTYHNPKRKDTFGKASAKITKILFNDTVGNAVEILSDTILSPYAEQIRSRQIKQIDIYLD